MTIWKPEVSEVNPLWTARCRSRVHQNKLMPSYVNKNRFWAAHGNRLVYLVVSEGFDCDRKIWNNLWRFFGNVFYNDEIYLGSGDTGLKVATCRRASLYLGLRVMLFLQQVDRTCNFFFT